MKAKSKDTKRQAQCQKLRDKRHSPECAYQRQNATKGECDCGYFKLPESTADFKARLAAMIPRPTIEERRAADPCMRKPTDRGYRKTSVVPQEADTHKRQFKTILGEYVRTEDGFKQVSEIEGGAL
jgi:hypothetical protein